MNPSLLEHALGPCTDPDCELHNIVAAAEELVIDENNLAYWICGAQFAEHHSHGEAAVELARALAAMSSTQQRLEVETRTVETDLAEDR